jgi:hypothetical protein
VTIKSEIEKSLKSSQRGMRISAGDQFWRGMDLITVKSTSGGVTFSVVSKEEEVELARPDFMSRALVRVPHGKTKKYDFLRQIYSIISNKKLSKRQRITIAKKYAKFAKSIDDAKIIRRWLIALAQDGEPKGFRDVKVRKRG